MFFEANDGCSYPVGRITRIHPASDGTVRVDLTDGESVLVYPWWIGLLMKRPLSAFAALPGTFIVEMSEDSERVFKTPVVGWCVSLNGDFLPITPNGVNDGGDDCLRVLSPDGTVTNREESSIQPFEFWVSQQKLKPVEER